MKPGHLFRLVLGSLLLAVALMSGRLETAHAATLTVNTTDDENDHSCTDGDCSLRDAIELAASGDTIAFSLTYPATISLGLGQLTIDKDLTLSGPGTGNLTVDGKLASRVLWINSGVTVSVSGVTIAHGKITGVSEAQQYGAGIHNEGTLTVTDSTFSGNIVRYVAHGGAIEQYTSAAATIDGSTFYDNHAGRRGGALGAYWKETMTITNSTFSANTASGS